MAWNWNLSSHSCSARLSQYCGPGGPYQQLIPSFSVHGFMWVSSFDHVRKWLHNANSSRVMPVSSLLLGAKYKQEAQRKEHDETLSVGMPVRLHTCAHR
eukprot:6487785-Amphidinium_carterae.1